MANLSLYSGNQFNIFNPRPVDVHLSDVAHSLANNCRYNGHSDPFYSVAEHCVVASLCCPPEFALPVLLHDAAEAYMKDFPDPHKQLFPGYIEKELEVLMTILVGLKLDSFTDEDWAAIHEADMRMRATEKQQIMKRSGHLIEVPAKFRPYAVDLACLDPLSAKIEFIERFKALGGLRRQKNKLVYLEEREDGHPCGQSICPFVDRGSPDGCSVKFADGSGMPSCESYVPRKGWTKGNSTMQWGNARD